MRPRPVPPGIRRWFSRRAFSIVISLLIATTVATALALTHGASATQLSPRVTGNFLVDQDTGLAFPKNKQNEPAITRDPLTGVLIAGANEEIGQPLCHGTTAPLASPCPFAPGVPTSGYYRSTDNGQTWTGGYLPGFDTIGRVSGGDPSLDYGPRLCANGVFSFSCGATIYYSSLADPFPEFGGEQVTCLARTMMVLHGPIPSRQPARTTNPLSTIIPGWR